MRSQLRNHRKTATVAGAGLAVALAALAAGCGGGSSSSAAATTAAATTTTSAPSGRNAADQALFTYAACMRGKGVNIPDPVRGANGRYAFPTIPASVTSAAGVRAKAQACAAKLPRTGFRGGAGSATQRAAFQKFSSCMQKNGVTFGFGPGGPPAGRGPTGATGATGPRRGFPVVPGQRQPGQGFRPGQGGGGGFNSTNPKTKAALAKCRSLEPSGFGRGAAPTQTQPTQ